MSAKHQPTLRKPLTIAEFQRGNHARTNSMVLSPLQFSATLRRERRRTERSERPFLLMLAATGAIPAIENRKEFLDDLAAEIASRCRETDIVGWHHEGEVLGAIFTELGENDRSAIIASLRDKVSTLISQ